MDPLNPTEADEATEYLTMWLINNERFAYEASVLLDRADPRRELRIFVFRLVWEQYSIVANVRVINPNLRWQTLQMRSHLPQELFQRLDWEFVRAHVEQMGLPRALPRHVRRMIP